MKKPQQRNYEQVQVFASPEDGPVLAWQHSNEDAQRVQDVAVEQAGPHSNVAERAERIINILNTLAERNSLGGFNMAATDEIFREELKAKQGSRAPYIVKNALPKPAQLHKKAREDFYEATDFERLRGQGFTRGEVGIADHDKMWEDFHKRFGPPAKHDELALFRRTQEKFLPTNHPLRQENRWGKNKSDRHAA